MRNEENDAAPQETEMREVINKDIQILGNKEIKRIQAIRGDKLSKHIDRRK